MLARVLLQINMEKMHFLLLMACKEVTSIFQTMTAMNSERFELSSGFLIKQSNFYIECLSLIRDMVPWNTRRQIEVIFSGLSRSIIERAFRKNPELEGKLKLSASMMLRDELKRANIINQP